MVHSHTLRDLRREITRQKECQNSYLVTSIHKVGLGKAPLTSCLLASISISSHKSSKKTNQYAAIWHASSARVISSDEKCKIDFQVITQLLAASGNAKATYFATLSTLKAYTQNKLINNEYAERRAARALLSPTAGSARPLHKGRHLAHHGICGHDTR